MTEYNLFPLLEFQNVSVEYKVGKKKLVAIDNISLKAYKGETIGIVGESGCGKTTLAKTLLHLERPTKGKILFKNRDLSLYSKSELRFLRKDIQIIFQDYENSLNPRMTVYQHLKEALTTHNLYENDKQIADLIDLVHLPTALSNRYPFQLSGGQKQRIALARALSVKPELLILDEPLSSLDASVRMQIVELLQEIKKELNLTYFFITHDLSTLHLLADQVAVLYLGKLLEFAPSHSINKPLHPYTEALYSAAPTPDPEIERDRIIIPLRGEPPSPFNPPTGCHFHPRCPHATSMCKEVIPSLIQHSGSHLVACHLYEHKNQDISV